MRLRQYYVAVFSGRRAKDLLAVFGTIAATNGEAYQQAWDYIRDQWATDPAQLQYQAVVAPTPRRPRRKPRRAV